MMISKKWNIIMASILVIALSIVAIPQIATAGDLIVKGKHSHPEERGAAGTGKFRPYWEPVAKISYFNVKSDGTYETRFRDLPEGIYYAISGGECNAAKFRWRGINVPEYGDVYCTIDY